MSGVYMLTHPFMDNTFKLGCSTNIAQRLESSDYRLMFPPGKEPQLCGWISVDGYENSSEVRFLEQSVFHQLLHKRLFTDRELFKDITLEEVAGCLSNLQLEVKIHLDTPIDNGKRPKNKINFTKVSVKKFQVPILAKMKTYFDEHDRGKLILPCGYGKMYLALFLIKEKFNTAIIACPNLLLCQQFEEVARQICTEHTIGSRDGDKWIIITTYHIEKYKDYNPELFVVDEAHRTCVMDKPTEEETLHRSLLRFSVKKYLFMTATEKILKQNIEEESQEAWYSMDNRESYGDEICKKNFSEAIDESIISDYRLIVVNSGNPIQVVAAARQILGIKWLLTYHNTCESAKEFYQLLNSVGIPAFYIDGNMTIDQRTDILRAFENIPYSVLCSVNVLAEGISLPFVDSTYFVDPRNSEIDVIQRIGRCLRLYKEKTLATIILSENILEYASLLRSLVIYDSKSRHSIKNKAIGFGFSPDNISNMNKFIDIKNNLNVCIMGRREAQWQTKWELAMDYEQKCEKTIISGTKYKGIDIGGWIQTQKELI